MDLYLGVDSLNYGIVQLFTAVCRVVCLSLLLQVDYELWDAVDHNMGNVCDIGIEGESHSWIRVVLSRVFFVFVCLFVCFFFFFVITLTKTHSLWVVLGS